MNWTTHDARETTGWVAFSIGCILGSLIATLIMLYIVPPRGCHRDEAWVHPEIVNTWNVAHSNGCIPLDDLIGLLD